jgi:hypothetical protein
MLLTHYEAIASLSPFSGSRHNREEVTRALAARIAHTGFRLAGTIGRQDRRLGA